MFGVVDHIGHKCIHHGYCAVFSDRQEAEGKNVFFVITEIGLEVTVIPVPLITEVDDTGRGCRGGVRNIQIVVHDRIIGAVQEKEAKHGVIAIASKIYDIEISAVAIQDLLRGSLTQIIFHDAFQGGITAVKGLRRGKACQQCGNHGKDENDAGYAFHRKPP